MNTAKSIDITSPGTAGQTIAVAGQYKQLTAKSLLRYPGGKTRAIGTIVRYFPKNIREIASPFFGGGSIELFLASTGVTVHGYDIFGPLVEFWETVAESPDALADAVEAYYPLEKTLFYQLQLRQTRFKSKVQRAAAYYVLNRSSFSGATLSGGMSPGHPRFTRSSIERLRRFYNPNFQVRCLDFPESIALHKDSFLYLDPPYLITGSLYGNKGNAHRNFDHQSLYEVLRKRGNWILSYNECAEIRRLYHRHAIISPTWKYGMSSNKISREILVFSHDLHHLAHTGKQQGK